MKVLIFKAAAAHGLGYPSGIPVQVKNDKEAKKYIEEGLAREATAKDLRKETADSKANKGKETATK